MTSRARLRRRVGVSVLFGLAAALVIPALAAAHPLGNFTINHYAGIRVEPDHVLLDVVIDEAEIPAFQARLDFDTDGDGEVSDAETDAGRGPACEKLAPSLALSVDGAAQALSVVEAGLTFPPGVGGLSTMRMVCEFTTSLASPLGANATIDFKDGSFSDRLGWREIVVSGSGVTLTAAKGAELRTATTSARLTAYPTTLLTQALADTSIAMTATPGGPLLPPLQVPDASPLPGAAGVSIATATDAPPPAGTTVKAPVVTVTPVAPAAAGSVPGGVSSGDLPSIFRSTDLSPWVLLVSILTAAALGAGHALTPGHGKTLMAAYLVGTRGTPLHAAGLGLSVTLSHTIGILVLAGLVVGAQGLLPPDVIVRSAPVIAAVSIVLIGGWMLFGEGRRRWRLRVAATAHALSHAHGDEHTHEHDHEHDPATDHGQDQGPDHEAPSTGGEHSHGGVRHSHLPSAGATITWRSLFVLGLAGGLIPSASALLILLGSIAAGRPAFGFVLVVAFGLGMALVMSGIGLALVLARGRLDRVETSTPLGRFSTYLPLVASFLVFGLGLYLTFQAVAGGTTF